MSDEEGWVTDPRVIDTIVALHELRDGDQIVFTRDGFSTHGAREGGVFTLDGMTKHPDIIGSAGYWTRGHVIVAIGGGWAFCRGNIKGWRRGQR